jgi:hypothetical protein
MNWISMPNHWTWRDRNLNAPRHREPVASADDAEVHGTVPINQRRNKFASRKTMDSELESMTTMISTRTWMMRKLTTALIAPSQHPPDWTISMNRTAPTIETPDAGVGGIEAVVVPKPDNPKTRFKAMTTRI